MADTPEGTKKSRKKVKHVTIKETTPEETDTQKENIVSDNIENKAASPVFFAASTVRYPDITVFLRQFIMLLDAGTPILRALRALAKRSKRQAMRGLINDIA